jgi:putative lipoic acid-binding regulatory protein
VQSLEGRRPEISYPCDWTYRIISTDESELRLAIGTIVGASVHTLSVIGDSASGRYRRFELVVAVRDEEHRNTIFQARGRVASVRFVL